MQYSTILYCTLQFRNKVIKFSPFFTSPVAVSEKELTCFLKDTCCYIACISVKNHRVTCPNKLALQAAPRPFQLHQQAKSTYSSKLPLLLNKWCILTSFEIKNVQNLCNKVYFVTEHTISNCLGLWHCKAIVRNVTHWPNQWTTMVFVEQPMVFPCFAFKKICTLWC